MGEGLEAGNNEGLEDVIRSENLEAERSDGFGN